MAITVASGLTYAAAVIAGATITLLVEGFVMAGSANTKPGEMTPWLVGIPSAWAATLVLSIVLVMIGRPWAAVVVASLPIVALLALIAILLIVHITL